MKIYPCQFKVEITTGINHNKGSLLKQLSSSIVVSNLNFVLYFGKCEWAENFLKAEKIKKDHIYLQLIF